MNYTEVDFVVSPREPWCDILIAQLGDLGFDSFEETEQGVKAYIVSERFDPVTLEALVKALPEAGVQYVSTPVASRNWNAEWESSFQPVEVDGEVRIRAEFHEHVPGFRYEIVMTPRMAFGTGHHATTRMMIRAMLELDIEGRTVCDLGCGTAVLAILAEMRGASNVRAIDIDQQAVINAQEHIERNGCKRTTVEKGTADQLAGHTYAAILANIERNTLMRDMRAMRDALLPGGALLLSGFVINDRETMVQAVQAEGLTVASTLSEGDWCLLVCRK